MKTWMIVVLVLAGLCVTCSGGVVLLGLVAADDDTPGARPSGASASGCSSVVDGWQVANTAFGVVATQGNLTVELPWAFPYTDELRQGESEGAVWRAALGSRYEPGPFQRGSWGSSRLSGPATEKSTGRGVFILFISGAASGIASPVALIGPDDSIVAVYPDDSKLGALENLNRFPLSCADVAGRWKSGFSSVAERYAAGTGRYLGVEAVAAWRDMTLESDGSYRRESSAMLNGAFQKRVDSGSWSHDDWSLVLEPEGAEVKRFNAWYIAVQNGFLLKLNDQQFTADNEEFQRVE